MKRILFLSVVLSCFITSCKNGSTPDIYNAKANDPVYLHNAEEKMTEVIVHDIFSPPVAARIYAYANIAAYEALVPDHSDYTSLAGQLKGFEKTPSPEPNQAYCYGLSSVRAFLIIARNLTFSGDMYDAYEQDLYAKYENEMGIPSDVYKRSMAFGEAVANHVMDYSKKDNYKQTRGFRHAVTNAPGTWAPTPPAYMDAVEPFWKKIRPFTLDSAAQFAPPVPPKYNMSPNSDFYKLAKQVYDTGVNLTEEQKVIANFWDCNPFKMNVQGHAMFATKKISPGGHWMSISGLCARKAKADLMKTTEAYTLTSIALMDAFISCWDEKYRSNVVRPETVINQKIDRNWQPLLQTPPFPEYTSGHSVASNASAKALERIFGDHFGFADSTEVRFGIPVRSYASFRAAADEASISRHYGGIHYMPAIENGAEQGKKLGDWVLSKVKTKK
jgi:hypothetical protein